MIINFWRYAVVALLAVAAFWTALESDLTYDDHRASRELREVRSLTDFNGLVREQAPLRQISLLIESKLWKRDSLGYHAMNLLWHGLSALLLLLVLRYLIGKRPAAHFAAGLFALLPIGASAVGVVSHRNEIYGGFLILLACFAWLRPQRDWVAWSLGGVCAALAGMETSMVLLLPLLLLAYEWLLVAPTLKESAELQPKLIQAGSIGLILLIVHIAWMSWISSSQGHWILESWENPVPWSEIPVRLARDWPAAVLTALSCLLFPWPFNVDHSVTPSSWWMAIGGWAVLEILVVLILRQRRQRPWLAFALAWLLSGCVVASLNVFRRQYGVILEQELYIVMPALALLGGLVIEQVCAFKFQSPSTRLWVELASVVGVGIGLVGWSNARVGGFRSEYELIRDSLAHNSSSGFLCLSAGRHLMDARKTAEARDFFMLALKYNWNYYETYGNLGEVAMDQFDYVRAAKWYREALEHKPKDPIVLLRLGNALFGQKQFKEARECYQQVLDQKPRSITAYQLIADTYKAEDRIYEANRALEQARRLYEDEKARRIAAGEIVK